MNDTSTESPAVLPASLVAALPIAKEVIINLSINLDLVKLLERDMEDAHKQGAIGLARAFVVLHRLKGIRDGIDKAFSALFENYKNVVLPEALEAEGVTSLPLAEGYRVGVSATTRASIKPDKKEEAYDWLRANGLGDIITPVVNASTLSGAARHMMEEDNQELPADLFSVALMTTTSVTATRK